ncbi:MAG: hypothetical protein ACJ765_06645, partial [Chloroflexota bacterium]
MTGPATTAHGMTGPATTAHGRIARARIARARIAAVLTHRIRGANAGITANRASGRGGHHDRMTGLAA